MEKLSDSIPNNNDKLKGAAQAERWWFCCRCEGRGVVEVKTPYKFAGKTHDITTIFRCRCASAAQVSQKIRVVSDDWWEQAYGNRRQEPVEVNVCVQYDGRIEVIDLTDIEDDLPF